MDGCIPAQEPSRKLPILLMIECSSKAIPKEEEGFGRRRGLFPALVFDSKINKIPRPCLALQRADLLPLMFLTGLKPRSTIMLEQIIQQSEWWQRAAQTHDRHYSESHNISVADHLLAVARCVRSLVAEDEVVEDNYAGTLRDTLRGQQIGLEKAFAILYPAALLHDIGKPIEDKKGEMAHPLTGKKKPARHPLIGARAAVELVPDDVPYKDAIVALVEEHDTPYSWYRNFL
jgi:hypothetical protein